MSFEEAPPAMTPGPRNPSAPLVDPQPGQAARADHAQGPMDHARPARCRETRRRPLSRSAIGGDQRDRVWAYLFDGPYTRDPAAFKASIAGKAQSTDPLFFAILDNATGGGGRLSDLSTASIRPIASSRSATSCTRRLCSAPQGATEVQYLFAALRLRRTRLPPLRMEMQRAQHAFASRRGTLRLHVRRNFPPAHDCQGPQPRHGLVRHAR